MCGIAGTIRFDGRSAELSGLEQIIGAMRRRGPDGEGLIARGPLALGHRRLKVIDLSERGAQPMVDSELGLTLAFNGCIYNHRELRRELEARGYRFFSSSDTEVILKAYHAWGEDCVKRFNGMFAFAIAERDSGRVVLARDRLGIKPLYYHANERSFLFASSLPALLKGGIGDDGIDSRVDPIALHHYMTFHSVVPAPHTILNSVRKLPPASIMIIGADGHRHERKYWDLDFAEDRSRSFEEWQDVLIDGLRKAVKRRLVADVPVGVLLSGGLDSSLIVGLLAEAGQTGLETFSVGFESVGDEKGDEFRYSDIVAERFETRHHKLFVDSNELLPALADCVAAMSEPMVSHDVIGFYLLSREVAKHVKVVQSGQGADEVFGGYHWYPPMVGSEDPVADYTRVFFDCDHAGFAEAVAPELVGDDCSLRFVEDHFALPGAKLPIDKALRLDTTIMLVDDPVKRVDNMTMAWGLEARVPFLDHELVELAARIPAEHKIQAGGKYILKETARRVIPAEVIDRPKGYFPVPALKYLRGPYLAFVRDVLGSEKARTRGVFRQDYVQRLLDEPEEHITPLNGSKLWQVALLEHWFQTHLDD
ncbi:MAG TPA: N-acetylglutaminylglutamine amidotransferase [Gammaproteobacteria bacterium]|nr:N-acetylglutaminylglutamine amidotransferase [Gammaproteobacteria bacterium]